MRRDLPRPPIPADITLQNYCCSGPKHFYVDETKRYRAIAACRGARKALPEWNEPLFWEGKCHLLAGRDAKGKELLAAFVEKTKGGKLIGEARKLL